MQSSQNRHLTVKELPERIRPRERLISQGASSVSDTELLAIILSTGKKGQTSLDLSQRLIKKFESLLELGRADYQELVALKGVGRAKACQILAAFELSRRVGLLANERKAQITSPDEAARILMPTLSYLSQEHFCALILDTKRRLIKLSKIAIGALNTAIVYPREVFRPALKANASAIIVAHNHPSGDAQPSEEDIRLTGRLFEAGKILGVDLLDHIVIGANCYSSLRQICSQVFEE